MPTGLYIILISITLTLTCIQGLAALDADRFSRWLRREIWYLIVAAVLVFSVKFYLS